MKTVAEWQDTFLKGGMWREGDEVDINSLVNDRLLFSAAVFQLTRRLGELLHQLRQVRHVVGVGSRGRDLAAMLAEKITRSTLGPRPMVEIVEERLQPFRNDKVVLCQPVVEAATLAAARETVLRGSGRIQPFLVSLANPSGYSTVAGLEIISLVA